MRYVADDLDGAAVLDVGTRPTRWGGWLFAPITLWTPDGWGDGVPAEPLRRYSTAYLPTGVQPDRGNLLEYCNALWVRARLPIALGFAPPTCHRAVRGQFLNTALLAVSVGKGGLRVTPFVCGDSEWELDAQLRFSSSCPAERRREVAGSFWSLLASAPAALANYQDRFMCTDGHDISPTVAGYWQGIFHLWHSRW